MGITEPHFALILYENLINQFSIEYVRNLQERVNFEISSKSCLTNETALELDRALRVILWRTPNGQDAIQGKIKRAKRRREQMEYEEKLQGSKVLIHSILPYFNTVSQEVWEYYVEENGKNDEKDEEEEKKEEKRKNWENELKRREREKQRCIAENKKNKQKNRNQRKFQQG